jgi:TPR repeat protein
VALVGVIALGCGPSDRERCEQLSQASPGPLEVCIAECQAGWARGCVVAGYFHRYADPPQRESARGLFARACDLGAASGCLGLANATSYLLEDPVSGRHRQPEPGQPSALDLYRRACDLGAAAGCELAAVLATNGKLDVCDVELGFALHRRACELGLASSCGKTVLHHRCPVGRPTPP